MSVRLNIGCGRTPALGWTNIDNSMAIRLANAPVRQRVLELLGFLSNDQKLNIKFNEENEILFCDATRELPFESSTVECIYTSHMLEHLSRGGAQSFLKEAYRVLKPYGVLRVSVPDLAMLIDTYLSTRDADAFMTEMLVEAPPAESIRDKIKLLVTGYRHHQWMYDGDSLSNAMARVGFEEVETMLPGATKITDSSGLNLMERSDISVFVEGVKRP